MGLISGRRGAVGRDKSFCVLTVLNRRCAVRTKHTSTIADDRAPADGGCEQVVAERFSDIFLPHIHTQTHSLTWLSATVLNNENERARPFGPRMFNMCEPTIDGAAYPVLGLVVQSYSHCNAHIHTHTRTLTHTHALPGEGAAGVQAHAIIAL